MRDHLRFVGIPPQCRLQATPTVAWSMVHVGMVRCRQLSGALGSDVHALDTHHRINAARHLEFRSLQL